MAGTGSRVLSVGQCGFDHGSISRFLKEACEAHVDAADSKAEALDALRRSPDAYDLVLVNRVFDRGGSGMDLIREIRSDATFAEIPVMLVSNYDDAQQAAIDLGALPGFGKSDVGDPAIADRLRKAITCPGGA
jgi:CheY-like chemotaxis protein